MKIGRTSDNDVVLLDAGISRRHVRITERAGRHYAEELGSANGTRLNGQPLTGERVLQQGDRLTLGSVEFVFKGGEPEASRARTEVEVQAAEPPPPTPSAPARTEVELPAFALSPLVEPPRPAPDRSAPSSGPDLDSVPTRLVSPLVPASSVPARVAPGPAPADTTTELRAVVPAPARSVPAPARAASAPSGLSAAERARLRRGRGDTLGGQLKGWWSELPRGGKGALLTVAACLVLGMGVALVVVFRPPEGGRGPIGPEPRVLGLQPLPDSFGLGEGVTWVRPDMKDFDFEFVSPTRAVAVLHYQASGISQEEVSLSVNAEPVGWVPADLSTSSEREIQQILTPSVLRRNGRNQLVFDNVLNPPGREGWRVWNLWLEIIPVPELPPDKLLESARRYVDKARDAYERRDVGAENLFHAWRDYRSAWITLEALDEKPELYHDVRFMLARTAADLDQRCGQLMLDFQRSLQLKKRRGAAATLEEIKRRFPTPAHRCHNLALDKASQYEL